MNPEKMLHFSFLRDITGVMEKDAENGIDLLALTVLWGQKLTAPVWLFCVTWSPSFSIPLGSFILKGANKA